MAINMKDYEYEIHKTDMITMALHNTTTWGNGNLFRSEQFIVPMGRTIRMESIVSCSTAQVPMGYITLLLSRSMGGGDWRTVEGDSSTTSFNAFTEWQEEQYYDFQQGISEYYTSANTAIDAPRMYYPLIASYETVDDNGGGPSKGSYNLLSPSGGDNSVLWMNSNDSILIFSSNNYATYQGSNYTGGDYNYPSCIFTYTEFF